MSSSDRERWDKKYAKGEGPAHFAPKAFLTDHRHLLTGGRALDFACGFGGNALYLAELGYQVDAVDISIVALRQAQAEARRRRQALRLIQADLTRWWVPPRHYDLIILFLYSARDLMPQLLEGLRPGGLIFQLNRNPRTLESRPTFNPDFVIGPGELRRAALAAGLEILFVADELPDDPTTTALIARRPA